VDTCISVGLPDKFLNFSQRSTYHQYQIPHKKWSLLQPLASHANPINLLIPAFLMLMRQALLKPIPKPHCTKAQIAADNQEKAQKKKDKAAANKEQEIKKALSMKKVAAMQNQMHEEGIQSNLHVAYPPAKKTARVARPVVNNSMLACFCC